MTRAASAAGRGRIGGIDLIRGFAILLVLLRHAWPDLFGGAGIVGVVVFFGLSGYLITGVLLKDLTGMPGRVRYGHFYRNRALRLLPPLIAMIAVFSTVELAFDTLGQREGVVRAAVVGLTYTMNIPGFDHGSPALSHLWTLATEEQFYLVWPILLAAGIRYRRIWAVVVLAAVGVLCMCAVAIYLAQPDVEDVYTWPTSWAIVMVIGAAARIGQDRIASWLPRGRAARWLCTSAALAVLLGISIAPEMKSNPATYFVIGPVIGACTVVLVFHLRDWQTIPTQALRPLLELGTISYAAYLWNYPVIAWVGDRPLTWIQSVASIVFTILAATASWWLLERWTGHVKRYLDHREQSSNRISGHPGRMAERVVPQPAAPRARGRS